MNPKTRTPHPPVRLENAMKEAKLMIDPTKSAEEQVKDIVNQLRPILPMSSESIRLAIKIPAEFTGKSYGIVKNYAEIKREEWQSDGSWIAILEIPAAIQIEMLESLGKATHGNIQSKII